MSKRHLIEWQTKSMIEVMVDGWWYDDMMIVWNEEAEDGKKEEREWYLWVEY